MSARPKLSVCMIARDEAEIIGLALGCLGGFADEIVVVDTGSSDGTVDIARAHGAEVESFAWCDDFARARNASLARANGDWILVLDADEWIAPADLATLRAWIEGPRDRVAESAQRNYVGDASVPGFHAGDPPEVWAVTAPGYVIARQIRVFPNDERLRYEGCVHEQLEASAWRVGMRIEAAGPTIHHIGKMRTAAALERKARLYRALGELKLQQTPSGRALLELGVQCVELGEFDRAEELLTACLRQGAPLGDRAKAVSHLAGVLAHAGRFREADALLRRHLPEVSAYEFVWERWGSVLGRSGRTARAAEVLERAHRLFPTAAGITRLLGEAHLALGHFDRARATYERLRRLAGSRSGLGEAGCAVASAATGDPGPLRRALADPRAEVVASTLSGARRWLGAPSVLAAWPRGHRVDPELVGILTELLAARGRSGAVDGPRAGSPTSLEAIWRGTDASDALEGSVRERLRGAVGLAATATGVSGPPGQGSTERRSRGGQNVQVPGTDVR